MRTDEELALRVGRSVSMPLLECLECSRPISAAARSCPSCGAPGPGVVIAAHRQSRKDFVWAVAMFAAIGCVVLGLISGNNVLTAFGFIVCAVLFVVRIVGLFVVLLLIGVLVLLVRAS